MSSLAVFPTKREFVSFPELRSNSRRIYMSLKGLPYPYTSYRGLIAVSFQLYEIPWSSHGMTNV